MSPFSQGDRLKKLLSGSVALVLIGLGLNFASSAAVSVPSGNLLKNPGFETWSGGLPVNWTTYSSNTTLAKATTVHSGSYSAKLSTTSKTAVASGANDGSTPNVSSTQAGVAYTASCWTRVSQAITVKIQLHEVSQTGASVDPAVVTSLAPATTSKWYQFQVRFTATRNGDKLPLSVYSANLVSGGATFLLDDCSLTAADTTAPTTPGSLVVSPASPTRDNLSWTAATDNIGVSGYNILRNGIQIGSTSATTTAFSDTKAMPGSTYTYQVIAFDAAGNKSPAASATIALKPAAPTSLTIPTPTNTNPSLTWNTVLGATSYNVYRDGVMLANATTNAYSDVTAAVGSHAYFVTAVNSAGESPQSTTAAVLIDRTPPTITYTVTPVAGAGGWNNSQVTATFMCSDDSGGSGVFSCPNPQTLISEGSNQTITGTTVDRAGNAASVTTTPISIDETPPTLGTPSWSTASIVVGSNATLTVPATDSASGVVSGEYFIGSDPGLGNGSPLTYSNGNLSASLGANLATGNYSVNVRGLDAAGNWSGVSTITLVVTDQPPSSPANLTATATSPTQINLNWAASSPGNSPISGYQITRTASGTAPTVIATVPGTTYSDTAVVAGSADSYTVAAVDKYGVTSSASNSAGDTTPPNNATPYTTSEWNTALSAVIHSDVTQSTTLPNGNMLWAFGDTTSVNGKSTVGPFGYPHSAFVTQAPGTLNFTAVPGNYGYGWQPVPNWPDGTFFWMSTPVVDGGTLYVIGDRIQARGSSFSVVGEYIASFDAQTLAYQTIAPVQPTLPAGDSDTPGWGGITPGTNGSVTGWWLAGTHRVACSFVTDCSVGDAAFVPSGHLADSSAWQVYPNIIPASFNIGNDLTPLMVSPTDWVMFSKYGGPYGGTQLEELNASSIEGPWTVTGMWAAPSPSGTVTYNTAIHPEQNNPTGQMLISYNVNGDNADYHALFEYVPIP